MFLFLFYISVHLNILSLFQLSFSSAPENQTFDMHEANSSFQQHENKEVWFHDFSAF